MKRYVKEFANHCLNRETSQHHYNLEKVKNINSIVRCCEKGLITDFEAVKSIVIEMEK